MLISHAQDYCVVDVLSWGGMAGFTGPAVIGASCCGVPAGESNEIERGAGTSYFFCGEVISLAESLYFSREVFSFAVRCFLLP